MRSSQSVTPTARKNDPVQGESAPADALPYLLYLPDGYDLDPDRQWPLVLFLHGAGERGSDLLGVTTQGLPKSVEAGGDYPFVIVAPQCPWHSSWTSELTTLSVLLDEVSVEYRVDPDRTYVTGLSMGGRGTWAMATRYPDRFAAIAPICGGWLPEAVGRIRRLPVWAFHGEEDTVVPIAHTEELVAALESFGGDVRFTRYPDTDHDSWTRSYDDPELYAWLLAQRRGG